MLRPRSAVVVAWAGTQASGRGPGCSSAPHCGRSSPRGGRTLGQKQKPHPPPHTGMPVPPAPGEAPPRSPLPSRGLLSVPLLHPDYRGFTKCLWTPQTGRGNPQQRGSLTRERQPLLLSQQGPRPLQGSGLFWTSLPAGPHGHPPALPLPVARAGGTRTGCLL